MNFLTNVLITITFFLPGFLAKFVSDYLSQAKDAKSEVQITIFAILWNVPGIFGGWVVFSFVRKQLLTSQQFTHVLQALPWMLVYFVGATVLDYLIGRGVLAIARHFLSGRLDRVRTETGLQKLTDGLPWEKFLGVEDNAVIKIYPIGDKSKTLIGVLETAYQPGEEQRGITLLETAQYQDLLDALTIRSRTFLEFDSQLVFELFTLADLEAVAKSDTEGSPPPQ